MNGNGEIGAVAGIGTDLVDVPRIASLLERHGAAFLEKNFTPAEIAACEGKANAAQRFAARFAAKEAMAKALGTGFSGKITPQSLSIENAESGEPVAVLDAAAKARLAEIGARKMLVSITHLKEYAQAFAIAAK